MLAKTSTDATALPVFIAAVVALALPWLLVAITAMPVNRILLLQIVVFLAVAMLLCLPRVRVALMPRAARRAVAYRVAMEQFNIRGISANEGSHRHSDLRLPRGALRAHHRRRWHRSARAAIRMARCY